MKIKIRPTCMDCKKTIIDDLCLVMDQKHDFETCLCLNCRDKTKMLLRKQPYIQKMTLEILDSNVHITPCIDADIISAEYAKMLA